MGTLKRSSFRAAALLSLALAGLVGLAPTPVTRSDNFNNNALAAFWSGGGYYNMTYAEANQRLEFRRIADTGALSGSGVLFNPYGINWKKNFHIEWDYKLAINNVAAGRQVFMGTALVFEGNFPATMTGVACGLLRDGPLLYVGWLRFENGTMLDFDGTLITQTTGTIEIDWSKSVDRLTVKRSGGSPVHLNGLYAQQGSQYGGSPIAINLGAFTVNGNVNFSGNNVYIDNWEATFTKRGFAQ